MIMNLNTMEEQMTKLDKKIQCVHCQMEMVVDSTMQAKATCSCGKVAINNGVILEGAQGVDWVDVSPQLLTE